MREKASTRVRLRRRLKACPPRVVNVLRSWSRVEFAWVVDARRCVSLVGGGFVSSQAAIWMFPAPSSIVQPAARSAIVQTHFHMRA